MKIDKNKSVLLLIDFQEKLYPHMNNKEELYAKTLLLLSGAQSLGIEMMAARQYPKGLGDVVEEFRSFFDRYYDKISFSCCGSEELTAHLKNINKKYVIIAGIEAHVCVLQTVIDLKEQGYIPVVVADAIASRKTKDYDFALKRMEYEGAVLTTTESILFELCGVSGNETFKTISKLVK